MFNLHQVQMKTLLHHQRSNPQTNQDNPYLGITFSEDLKWKAHINNTSKKANSTLGFLRRNLSHCPLPCRKNAYLALVRSKLEYERVVWHPYLKNDIDRLERVQRSAARFITYDYKSRHEGCVTNMLDNLDLPSIEERRRQCSETDVLVQGGQRARISYKY